MSELVTERALLEALELNPADDDTRAVLADWLEEQGRANDAALVRVFLERKAMHAAAPDVVSCSERLAELASSSSWSGRRIVLCDPSLTATTQPFIDPPWTACEPLRLGRIPSGRGTPDLFVRVESDAGPLLRIDLYGSHGGATAQSGLVFVGHGDFVTCIEPYQRRQCSTIDLGDDFGELHRTDRFLLVTSAHRVFRLAPDGTEMWRSEPVGGYGARILALTGDAEEEIEIHGESDWDSWETAEIERRPFRLALANGALLEA